MPQIINQSQLKDAIVRLVTDQATDDDRVAVKRALGEGRIVIAAGDDTFGIGEGSVDVAQDVNGSIIVTGDGNLCVFNGVEPSADILKERLSLGAGILPPIPRLFIGREGPLQEIKRLLGVDNGGSSIRRQMIVRGWPGVGKTTFVAALAHNPDLAAAFPDGILWMALGQEPNIMTELAAWGRALGQPSVLSATTRKEAAAEIVRAVHGRRVLFIVDDLWKTEDAAPFLQLPGPGRLLVFTTRRTGIADDLEFDEKAIFPLPVLDEQDSLRLLKILAPAAVREEEHACLALVRDLENLPLALHVAGRLLRSEAKNGWGVVDMLEELREGAKLIAERAPVNRLDGEQVVPTVVALLEKSTDLLDAQTRDCYAMLGSFAQKPATFHIDQMAAHWRRMGTMEDPKPTVRILVDHGLLEPAGIGRFQMHALLVTHARTLLADEDP